MTLRDRLNLPKAPPKAQATAAPPKSPAAPATAPNGPQEAAVKLVATYESGRRSWVGTLTMPGLEPLSDEDSALRPLIARLSEQACARLTAQGGSS
jgi:hypothetical protein